ncbi:bifunctional acetate--CoA ligase family protein/GNAT family N-acetyltransferase [Caenimonas sedimenti]|uniref:Bifunctional acetate--CoA ligase family protein/GNAT family N-acetyltransferase n=1 Tax=Caenimonas sedimenti TaxID=2596921 RepID=A0A562ZWE4_9BURK|nr:bifunctional acetate--CoA ligase family protein/GNAT family N-acetyltransferase [Caenimonas sedimenti]TWO72706.1 bifunctional acetate--CoA ligase family protein/GNAT family N-acetyltransferase [Caenimonas sedimenti]
MSIRNLESLFAPHSVAVIGASDRPGSLGAVVLANLKQGGFTGQVWSVNQARATVDGQAAWPDVGALPGIPDLAVICTPAATVPGLIAELGRKGTRAAIVLSAGMKQPAPGGEGTLEQAMLDAAKPYLLRILGPNCIGLLVPAVKLNASFAPGNAMGGTLSFVTQSGALATAMLDWAGERSIGFSHFVSLGDSADVDFGDVLNYLGSDPGTRAILLYAESIKASRKFMSAARAAARNKPVIVVKAGRTPAAAKAAASHTGALAGADKVFDAAARRAGMLRVDTLESLFDAAQTLAYPHPWRGERLAILTNGGGAGVLAADALALSGGTLAQLSETTLGALGACLPSTWSGANPVDIVGDAPASRYAQALAVLLAAPEVDGVLFMHAPTAIVPSADIVLESLPLMQGAAKPVLSCWMGGQAVANARTAFSREGLPWYSTPERAVTAWLQLVHYHRNQAALLEVPAERRDFTPDRERALAILRDCAMARREWLDPEQAHDLLAAYGVPSTPTRMVLDAEEAAAAAGALGYPVALKVVSQQIVHKSDVGGVALGLANGDELRKAIVLMHQRIAHLRPHARVLGFAVQPMVKRRHARELIAGIGSDPVFGPVLLFGQGGTGVELSAAHAIGLPPLNAALARDLIARSGVAPWLDAHRGEPAAKVDAVVDTLERLALMASELGPLAELDINPLVADEHGVVALDVRARVRLAGAAAGVAPAICPYPAGLEERVTVAGTELLLRPIRPADAGRLKAFYAKSPAHDMRLRFFMTRREVGASELARYSQIDYDREIAFLALAPRQADGSQRMVAEVRAVCDPDNQRAEMAIHVASAWQHKGLGRLLLRKLVDHLRARGTREIVAQCLPENEAMAGLARSLGFTVRPDGDTTALGLVLRSREAAV